jgi:hypothetical protein
MSDDFGLSKVLSQLSNLKGLNLEKIGMAGAYKLLAESQKLAPVDSGFLRSSGNVEGIPDKGANVVYSANYSFYQEWGFSNYAGANNGTGFIRPAIDQKSDEILQAMKNEIEKQEKENLNK